MPFTLDTFTEPSLYPLRSAVLSVLQKPVWSRPPFPNLLLDRRYPFLPTSTMSKRLEARVPVPLGLRKIRQ